MTIKKAISRVENDLLPQLEKAGIGRGILEGGLMTHGAATDRALAVEMVALHIAIKESQADYFNYKLSNWLPRAIYQANWNDSLSWWASVDASGFESQYRHQQPMPEDLKLSLSKARILIHS